MLRNKTIKFKVYGYLREYWVGLEVLRSRYDMKVNSMDHVSIKKLGTFLTYNAEATRKSYRKFKKDYKYKCIKHKGIKVLIPRELLSEAKR